MRITRIDHVAVCLRDLDSAIPSWMKLLGLNLGPRELVEAQKTEAAFLMTPEEAGCTVELIAPQGGNAGLEKFIERNNGKSGLHHIAFAVDDLAGALRELDALGVPLIDKVPRPGARGHEVGFLHPKAGEGVLIELVSDHAHGKTQGRH
jgi:methylmalonyl-CoA epimerase